MKVKEIRYKRVINLGSYENEQIEAVAEVEENESPEMAMEQLKYFVRQSSIERIEREKREKEMQARLERARQEREAAQLRQEPERREEEKYIDEYEGDDNDEDEDEEEVSF